MTPDQQKIQVFEAKIKRIEWENDIRNWDYIDEVFLNAESKDVA